MKPEFLYHGSPLNLKILIPKQSNDGTELGSKLGIYACEHASEVLTFAIPKRWHPDNPGGRRVWSQLPDGRGLIIEHGTIDPFGVGYIHKIRSANFDKLDTKQWLSTVDVDVISVSEVKVEDYWHMIHFSQEALAANKLRYPSNTLYINK